MTGNSGVDEPELSGTPFRTCYLAVPVIVVKSAGTLHTYRSGTYLQWADMMIMLDSSWKDGA